MEAACEAYADATCNKLTGCAIYAERATYADAAACRAGQKATCIIDATAYGSTYAPADISSCAAAYAAGDCSTLTVRPTACRKPGTRANGASCGTDAQCSSSACTKASGAACGICKARVALGQSCGSTTADCAHGLTCDGGVCKNVAALGASCVSAACSFGNTCHSTTKTCVALRDVGQSCDDADLSCNILNGGICTANTCTALTYGAAGATCSFMSGALCAAGDCVSGKCVAQVPVGASCAIADCQNPLRCDTATKTCVVHEPWKCQ